MWLAIRSSLEERAKDGGPDRDRTGDLMNAIHARSQLRYWPIGLPTEARLARCATFACMHERRLGLEHSIVAHGRGPGNQVGHGSGRPAGLRRLTRVSQDEPTRQQIRCFFRGRAIERHQRCRHSGHASELRPPLVANRRDFNVIRASADIVLEAMNVHRKSLSCVKTEAQILRGRYVGSSEARREDGVHRGAKVNRLAICQKKNLRCQLLHRFCTIHAQVFHRDAANELFEPKSDQRVE